MVHSKQVDAKKTKHMLVLRNKDLVNTVEALSVNFAGAILGKVPANKYLGVDLDRNMTYENAVHNTYVKANKNLFTLLKIRPYISQSTAALIYKQFILPILDYVEFMFESTVKRELEMLDKVQARAIPLIRYVDASGASMERVYSIIPLKSGHSEIQMSTVIIIRALFSMVI